MLKELSALSEIFETARIDWGMPVTNPVRDVRKPPKGKPRKRRFLSTEEEERIHAAMAQYADGWALPLVELAVETAMRRGEWKYLDWSDVDLDGQTMILHQGETKNDEGRVVPLSLRAVAILRAMKPSNFASRMRLFNRQPGTITAAFARSRDAARAKYVAECDKNGIEPNPDFLVNLHLHDLRHEVASRLFEKGLGVMEAASVTGHKTLAVLKDYTHLKAQNIAKKLR